MADCSVEKVCAVVVTYYPEVEALRALITAIAVQVGAIVVVDNTGQEEVAFPDVSAWAGHTHVLRQQGNIGL
ncbi:hypothetical protein, partial [Staphylococcus aureus]|uniref:hypothetical protein n=1 Tax=Staphylococcus aureus TaxID=1280 RepID=UPI0039BDC9F5